jgi:hypothetical protein
VQKSDTQACPNHTATRTIQQDKSYRRHMLYPAHSHRLESITGCVALSIPILSPPPPIFTLGRTLTTFVRPLGAHRTAKLHSRHTHNWGSAPRPPRGVYTLCCLYGVTLLFVRSGGCCVPGWCVYV